MPGTSPPSPPRCPCHRRTHRPRHAAFPNLTTLSNAAHLPATRAAALAAVATAEHSTHALFHLRLRPYHCCPCHPVTTHIPRPHRRLGLRALTKHAILFPARKPTTSRPLTSLRTYNARAAATGAPDLTDVPPPPATPRTSTPATPSPPSLPLTSQPMPPGNSPSPLLPLPPPPPPPALKPNLLTPPWPPVMLPSMPESGHH